MSQVIFRTTKKELIESFAKARANAEWFVMVESKDLVTVMYDNVHGQDFKISEVIENVRQKMLKSGIVLEIAG